MNIRCAALLITCSCLPLAAKGPVGPPEKDHLSVNLEYSGREDFISRSAGFDSAFALGSAAGYRLSGFAAAAHCRFPGSDPFPCELYETGLGLRASGRIWSFGAGAKSNSDRPYGSPEETDFSLDASRTLSRSGPHMLMFGVSYSSRRSFLKGVPFPYLSYAYHSENLSLFLPFGMRWKFAPGTELSASYFPPKYFSLSVTRAFPRGVSLSLYGGLQLKQYLPADRPDKDYSLFLELPHAGLRAGIAPAPGWEASLWTAWGFRGSYFTGEQYDQRHAETSVGAGPSAGLSLKRLF